MSAALTGNGDTGFFFASDGTDWEVFLGTRASATTLERTLIYASSNSGNAVDWSATSKDVVGSLPARFCELLNTIPITVESGATTDIGAVKGSQVQVIGSATITSFGAWANKLRFVHFSGSPTLTHNATSLILPGAANIAVTAGSTGIFRSDNSSNWRCLSFTPGDVTSFTPTLTFGGGSTGITYAFQQGAYLRIGRLVVFQLQIILTSKGSSSGNAAIGGLPFAAAQAAPCSIYLDSAPTNSIDAPLAMISGSSILLIAFTTSSGQGVSMSEASFTNDTDVRVAGSYFI